MAELKGNAVVSEMYFSNTGDYLQGSGDFKFYAQSNYTNMLIINLESEVDENELNLINFTPLNTNATYVSHWFYLQPMGLRDVILDGENTPRTFASYSIVVPNLVLGNNKVNTIIENEITVVKRYGGNNLGFYNKVYDLISTNPASQELYEKDSFAYVSLNSGLGESGIYVVDYNSTNQTYNWRLVSEDTIDYSKQQKQYEPKSIYVQKGNESKFDLPTVSVSTIQMLMQNLSGIAYDVSTLQEEKNNTYNKVEIDNKDTAIMNKVNDLENANMFKDVVYNNVNGVLTFTKYDDTTKAIDLPLELLVNSGYYDEVANELVLVLANGSEIRIPVGNLLTDLDAHNIRFNGSGTNYLVNKPDVESAVKELDTRVKTNADNVALKVSTSDIVDDLVSTDGDKPLSANQGKVLNDITEAVKDSLEITNIHNQLLLNKSYIHEKWTAENMFTNGDIGPSTTYILSSYLYLPKNTKIYSNKYLKYFYIHYFDSELNYTGNSGAWLTDVVFDSDVIIRLVARNIDSSIPENMAEIYSGISFTIKKTILNSDNTYNIYGYEYGGLLTDGTESSTNNIRCRSDYIKVQIGQNIFSIDNTCQFIVHYYDDNKTWLFGENLYNHKHTVLENGYVRLVVKHKDDSAILTPDTFVENIYVTNYLYNKEIYIENNIDPIYEISGTAGQSIINIGNELWGFLGNSSDDDTTWAGVYRYSLDLENETKTDLGSFQHNWGHCNTVDYKPETDTIILGSGTGVGATNGRGDYDVRGIFLFPNASSFSSLSTVDINTYGIIIDVESQNWGRQLNVVWGENNNNKYNVCYVMSNDGDTISDTSKLYANYTIRKVLLGQGTNNLGSGTLLSGKTGLEFNGTYKVLETYTLKYGHNEYECIQDAVFHCGKIYTGLGHDGIWFNQITFNENLELSMLKKRYMNWYDDNGNKIDLITQALTIHNNMLYIRVYDSVTKTGNLKIYKL